MRCAMILRPASVAILLALSACWYSDASAATPAAKGTPPFPEIRKTVDQFFRRIPGYQPGDIISRGQVESLLAQLAQRGFAASDRKEIVADVPGDEEFLVTTLRTFAGRKFMRRMAAYPGGYDRLDRLALLPHGQQTIVDLVREPGGDKMVQYMTTTPGGAAMGRMLSAAPRGAGFNDPTGRIYTVHMLLARLKESYDAATANKTTSH